MTTTDRTKGPEYYLGLDYPVMLKRLSAEEGGGYIAAIPELGISTFVAAGETAPEALENLDLLRLELIPELIEAGVELPEPEDPREGIGAFSGTFLVRGIMQDITARCGRILHG